MNWGTVLTALIIGLPSTLLGVLAYRRSRKVDAVAEQSGVATETRAGTAQIIQGLNDLVENLQTDNTAWRNDIKYLTQRLDECFADREQLRKEVARLRRKYGDNSGEDQHRTDHPQDPA